LIFKAPNCGCGSIGEILVSPGIGPINRALAREISELTRPIQNLSSFLRGESLDYTDE